MLALGLGVSLILSAWRSLGREFSGVVVEKRAEAGYSSSYWVYLVSSDFLKTPVAHESLVKKMTEAGRRRVGISRVVFGETRELQTISKAAFSPFIYLDEDRHLDLGVQWLFWGIISIAVSIFTFRSGQKPAPEEEESMEAPLAE
ncbi:MAG: hypothetical protein GX442_18770 [Candidatus Riflebacteria bacterium]|nr:hypothetical protein [Candidatus Riflebacteria bacterium]